MQRSMAYSPMLLSPGRSSSVGVRSAVVRRAIIRGISTPSPKSSIARLSSPTPSDETPSTEGTPVAVP